MKVVVIGAGVVGICCASYLQRDGHELTVLDPVAPGGSCSFGNSGSIAPGSCVPLALPGVLRKVPSWLLDPEGPLKVDWRLPAARLALARAVPALEPAGAGRGSVRSPARAASEHLRELPAPAAALGRRRSDPAPGPALCLRQRGRLPARPGVPGSAAPPACADGGPRRRCGARPGAEPVAPDPARGPVPRCRSLRQPGGHRAGPGGGHRAPRRRLEARAGGRCRARPGRPREPANRCGDLSSRCGRGRGRRLVGTARGPLRPAHPGRDLARLSRRVPRSGHRDQDVDPVGVRQILGDAHGDGPALRRHDRDRGLRQAAGLPARGRSSRARPSGCSRTCAPSP